MIRTYLRNKLTGKPIKEEDYETVTEKLCDICKKVVKKGRRRSLFDVKIKMYGGNFDFESEEVCHKCMYSIEKHFKELEDSKKEEIKYD